MGGGIFVALINFILHGDESYFPFLWFRSVKGALSKRSFGFDRIMQNGQLDPAPITFSASVKNVLGAFSLPQHHNQSTDQSISQSNKSYKKPRRLQTKQLVQ